ncbi:hypothetical protein [Rhodovibrio sodomensis]|nr:hypothetical protein [Rhodovibrio sodomensis]
MIRLRLSDGLEAAVREELEAIQRDNAPASYEQILESLQLMAERKGVDLPSEKALEMDLRVLHTLPADLFKRAFVIVWAEHKWPRMPEVGDFVAAVRDELAERRTKRRRAEGVLKAIEEVRSEPPPGPPPTAEQWSRLRAALGV